jgi:hypothetical protein
MVPSHISVIFLVLSACSWAQSGVSTPVRPQAPICERYWTVSMVFVGTAESIQLESSNDGGLVRQRVRLSVQEVFRGIEGATVDVVTDYAFAHSYQTLPFASGVQYLVFATPEYGEIMVRRSYPPHPVAEAQEDLSFLENAKRMPPSSLVYGSVMRRQRGDSDDADAPLAGVKIEIQGPEKKSEVTTDESGNYSIRDLSPGKYTIQPLLSEKLDPIDAETIEVPEHGCLVTNFESSHNGRIRGKVTDFDGNPLAKTNVEIMSADPADEQYASEHYETDEHGLFEIDQVKPGRYVLGVNIQFAPDATSPYEQVFYPGVLTRGAASVISVGKGELLEGYDMRVRKIEEIHTFTVRVVSAKGEPTPNAWVTVRYANGSWLLGGGHSDKKGGITISAYGHGVVSLEANATNEEGQHTSSEPTALSLTHIPKNLELRLTKVKESRALDSFGAIN